MSLAFLSLSPTMNIPVSADLSSLSKRQRLMRFVESLDIGESAVIDSNLCDRLGYSDWRKLTEAFRRLSDRADLDFVISVRNTYRGVWLVTKECN